MGTPAKIRTAKWRERHPDRVTAYHTSERGRQVARDTTARWRARNPQPKKPPPQPLTVDEQKARLLQERAAYMRNWDAAKMGIAPCFEFPDPPEDNLCANCGREAKLHLDHDHKTGKFRGYLCIPCNMGIGQLGDDIAGLERALSYLRGTL
jgi:hypothetical protein